MIRKKSPMASKDIIKKTGRKRIFRGTPGQINYAQTWDLIHLTDDPEEVANGIERHYQKDGPEKNF
jgi:hypothetical protein